MREDSHLQQGSLYRGGNGVDGHASMAAGHHRITQNMEAALRLLIDDADVDATMYRLKVIMVPPFIPACSLKRKEKRWWQM